ncbi:zinc finger protein 449-like [Fukomys damarensis]|uniref:zinc finger protein 449-like n=1 Tax=Fukomys damarensis TaxID=885580 RepID=UPI0014550428|nr:zinc finger protein 449-like [Fukomys damarensis]
MERGREMQASLLSVEDPMQQDTDTDCEVSRMQFRHFKYSEEEGPWENFNRLWELCCQWLKPKVRSIEQVLELLVMEQFLTVLPTEIETWVSAYAPESKEKLFALIELLQSESEPAGHQELMPFGMVSPLPAISPEPPALLLMGQVQEFPVPGPWNPQAGPRELNCGEADKSLTFPDPEPDPHL